MDIARPSHLYPQKVDFTFCTTQDVHKLSVVRLSNPVLMDDLGRPSRGGLYDPAMGPTSRSDRCITCGHLGYDCLGHFGHIDLCVPIFNPVTFPLMVQLLRGTCLYCHNLLLPAEQKALLYAKLLLLDHGMMSEVYRLDEVVSDALRHAFGTDFAATEDSTNKDEATEDNRLAPQASTKPSAHSVNQSKSQFIQEAICAFIADKQFSDVVADPDHSNSVCQLRLALIQQFLSTKSSVRRCATCSAINARIRPLEGIKIFQYPLQSKQSREMQAKGLVQPNVVEHDPNHSNSNSSVSGPKLLTPLTVQKHFQLLWERENRLLDLIVGSNPPKRTSSWEMFFYSAIPVPPNRFRPMNVMDDKTFEHPQNTYLAELLKTNLKIVQLTQNGGERSKLVDAPEDNEQSRMNEGTSFKFIIDAWLHLQQQANFLYDSSKNSLGPLGKEPPAGIKQLLEKKEGLFRMHMMGKRVNYSARTVISPDPNLETGEIGVPMVFARKLTYPEPVTRYNYAQLRQAVINGPSCHPGATHIQREDGYLVSLEGMSQESRISLANQLLTNGNREGEVAINKKVYRHLKNGDALLLNRQPTLHRSSIMAHRCRVLEGEKVLRMHYVNCKSYNADFDGDEMNIHFPQNEIARSEAYNIVSTDFQYLAVTDGKPIRGLIQDHVGSAVWLTMRDSLFSRETYHQLLFGTFEERGRIKTIPPCIVKPVPLWSGKQLITTLLLNLVPEGKSLPTLAAACKIPSRLWPTSEEGILEMLHGYLLTGVLDNSHIGNATYGLTHAIQELYGGAMANKFLSAIGKALTKYLQMTAYTCRLDDMMLTKQADQERADIIRQADGLGTEVAFRYAKLDATNCGVERVNATFEKIIRSPELIAGLDSSMKGAMNRLTSKIIQTCLPQGQLISFPWNNMSLMTVSGAKGSNVNFSQISCCLGQQELEGKRVPVMTSGKTLPSFLPFDTRAVAGGYVTSRFLTGITPQEFYFHCMAGREGLIDTAIKTARTGYLQRCLVKNLESLQAAYDCTVRSGDGTVVQFLYGDDGLDATKQKWLNKFEFVARNFQAYLDVQQPAKMLDRLDTSACVEWTQQAGAQHCDDTLMNRFIPTRYLGSVSERFSGLLESFIEAHKDTLLAGSANRRNGIPDVTVPRFRAVMWLKFLHSLVDPGESIGVLAAQSIGEPATQMTLNTFHLAGFGAKNVTLGVPRLRELLMTAARNLSTPTMTLPLRAPLTDPELARFASSLSRVTLRDILRKVTVCESLVTNHTVAPNKSTVILRTREYRIELELLPLSECLQQHGVSMEEIKQMIDKSMIKQLVGQVTKQLKRAGSADESAMIVAKAERASVPSGSVNQDDDVRTEPTVGRDEEDNDERRGNGDSDEVSSESDEEAESEAEVDSDEAPEPTIQPVEEEKRSKPAVKHHLLKAHSYDPDSNQIALTVAMPATLPKLLMLDLVEKLAGSIVLHELAGISKCYWNPEELQASREDPSKAQLLHTDGVNLRAIWDYSSQLDINSIYTNDIHAVLECYGIEAARSLLVREIGSVFDAYGISLDPRHLSLIADRLTMDGTYSGFNRSGMDRSGPWSPILQMSFETVLRYLKGAAQHGASDLLQSPSSRLVMGVPTRVGTGLFGLVQDFSLQQ